jgi:protocatechuate 3,4-dioxygenase beta subunit
MDSGRRLMLLLALLLTGCARGVATPTASTLSTATPVALATPTSTASGTPRTSPPAACTPTMADDLSPSYRPGAPVRAVVGRGHVLSGIVQSGRDCAPIAGARLELWPEAPGGDHPEASRATHFTDSAGAYQFECDPPDHIHLRVTAPGHRTFASNAYHPQGRALGTYDIVLVPDEP